MNADVSSVWVVTREYAGIAEAGGVKNVACSLAEGLARLGVGVTAFVPRYGCVLAEGTPLFKERIDVAGVAHSVEFSKRERNGVKIVFVGSPIFREKHAVYVYTDSEVGKIPGASRGKGHFDVDDMNALFQKAVLAYARRMAAVPDIVHCQDAHTALLPTMARLLPEYAGLFGETAFVVTIHNAGPGYRQTLQSPARAAALTGLSPETFRRGAFKGAVEPFLLASDFAALSTVSPWYADELMSARYDAYSDGLSGEFERRGIRVAGITNGIDYHRYEPRETDISLLPFAFDPPIGDLEGKYRVRGDFIRSLADFVDTDCMECCGTLGEIERPILFSYHGRIASQKGLDSLARAARIVLDRLPQAQFAILGQGEPALESLLVQEAMNYPGRFAFLRGYERSYARMIVAISDFLVLPSVFEPCGLEDYIGQIYGTIPVAHAVGGLRKIQEGKNGFLYESETNDPVVLADTLIKLALPIVETGAPNCAAVPEYLSMIRYASAFVRDSCSWERIIRDFYLPLYGDAMTLPCEKNAAEEFVRQ
jgi:starch synthase